MRCKSPKTTPSLELFNYEHWGRSVLEAVKRTARPETVNLADAEMKCQALYIQYFEEVIVWFCDLTILWKGRHGLLIQIAQFFFCIWRTKHSCLDPVLQFHCSWCGWSSPFPTTSAAGGLKGQWQQLGITSTERMLWIHSFAAWAAMTLKSSNLRDTATHCDLSISG